jgi:hypothetical protein
MDMIRYRKLIINVFKRANELINLSVKDLCYIYEELSLDKNKLNSKKSVYSNTIEEIVWDIIGFEYNTNWNEIFLSNYNLVIEMKSDLITGKYIGKLRFAGDFESIKESLTNDPKSFIVYCKGLFPKSNFIYILDEPD